MQVIFITKQLDKIFNFVLKDNEFYCNKYASSIIAFSMSFFHANLYFFVFLNFHTMKDPRATQGSVIE